MDVWLNSVYRWEIELIFFMRHYIGYRNMKIEEFMSRNLEYASMTDSLQEAVRKMTENNVRIYILRNPFVRCKNMYNWPKWHYEFLRQYASLFEKNHIKKQIRLLILRDSFSKRHNSLVVPRYVWFIVVARLCCVESPVLDKEVHLFWTIKIKLLIQM